MTPTTLTLTNTLTTQSLTLIDSLPALLVIFATTLLIFYGLRLVRAEGPEEQARAQKILAGCIIAGVLMALGNRMGQLNATRPTPRTPNSSKQPTPTTHVHRRSRSHRRHHLRRNPTNPHKHKQHKHKSPQHKSLTT